MIRTHQDRSGGPRLRWASGPHPQPHPNPNPNPNPNPDPNPDNPDPNQVGMGPELASEIEGGTAEAGVEQVRVRIRVS